MEVAYKPVEGVMLQNFMKKTGGPKTAVEMWLESKTLLPFTAWTPTKEQQAHLENFFAERAKPSVLLQIAA